MRCRWPACLPGPTSSKVQRGDMANGPFCPFRYQGEKLIAIHNVNTPKDHLLVYKLMEGNLAYAAAGEGCGV